MKNESSAQFLLFGLACIGIFLALGLWWRSTFFLVSSRQQSQAFFLQIPDRERVTLQTSEQKKFTVEVVNTPASVTQGLSGRDQIGADGMLFVFEQTHVPTFWMKEMKFNLDLVWIRNNEVIEVTKNVPAPVDPDAVLPLYSPTQRVNMVLEVPAGQADQLDLQPGQMLSIFQPQLP